MITLEAAVNGEIASAHPWDRLIGTLPAGLRSKSTSRTLDPTPAVTWERFIEPDPVHFFVVLTDVP